MKKELYEKPKLETISLVDVDIITSSAGEGGDVPVENNENGFNNIDTNEIDPSPWTKNDSFESHGFFDRFWNIFDDYASQGNVQDNTPIDNGTQEIPSEEVPMDENISEEVPLDNGENDINE